MQTRKAPRCGYAIVLIDGQSFEGWTTVDATGVLHIDQCKLRVKDAAQKVDGIRRQQIQPRTFSPSCGYEIRWLREAPQDSENER